MHPCNNQLVSCFQSIGRILSRMLFLHIFLSKLSRLSKCICIDLLKMNKCVLTISATPTKRHSEDPENAAPIFIFNTVNFKSLNNKNCVNLHWSDF